MELVINQNVGKTRMNKLASLLPIFTAIYLLAGCASRTATLIREAEKIEAQGSIEEAADNYYWAVWRDSSNIRAKRGLQRLGQSVLEKKFQDAEQEYHLGSYFDSHIRFLEAYKYRDRIEKQGICLKVEAKYDEIFLQTKGILYETGKKALDNSDYREAYNLFQQVLLYVPDYRDAVELSKQAAQSAIDKIRIVQKEAVKYLPMSPIEELDIYFPCQKGNFWKYNLYIPTGGFSCDAWWSEFYRFITFSGGDIVTGFAQEDSVFIKVEDSFEISNNTKKYNITTQDSIPEIWEIKVGELIKVQQIAQQGDLEYLQSPKVVSREKFKAGPSFLYGGYETLAYRYIYFSIPIAEDKSFTLKPTLDKTPIYTRYSGKFYTIQVPAGTFTDCIEIIEEKNYDDFKWKTYLYYAPLIGLVLRYQTDFDGNPKSYMELREYEVAPTIK